MKTPIIILSMLLFSFTGIMAQNRDDILKYQGEATRAISLIEKNPKNIEKFYFQLDVAGALMNLYEVNTKSLNFSVKSEDLARIYLGVKSEKVEDKEDGQDKITIYTYPFIRLTFINDLLRNWEVINVEVEDILGKALEAINKASELYKGNDEEAKAKLDVYQINIRQAYNVKAFSDYFGKDYKGAYYDTQIYLGLTDKARKRDTIAQIYSVYYAHYAGMKDEILQAFDKAVTKKYREKGNNEGQMFLFAYNVYMERQDTANALKTMLKGAEFYPENYDVIVKLIDLYRDLNKNEEAISFINKAKLLSPDNAVLYLIEASLQHEMGNDSIALVLYKKVTEMDPTSYKAWLNLGAAEFEKGKKMLSSAQDEKEYDVYSAKKKIAEDQLNLAIPYLEHAAELNPDQTDLEILQTLKTLYYQLRVRFPEYEAKFKALDAKLPKPSAATTSAPSE